MKRKKLTRAQYVKIYDAAGGICHICQQLIYPHDKWDADHVKALWLGGEDKLSNMAPAHVRCHAGKTASEAPVRAKGTRVRAAYIGVPKTSPRPILGSKASGWKHKLDGTWQRRRL